MIQAEQTNIGVGLVLIHRVITRGLAVARENSECFAEDGFPDKSTADGFVNYVRTLVSMINAHHLAEEDLAFPYLHPLLPEAPYDVLLSEHRVFEPILGEVAEAIDGAESSDALYDLHSAVSRLEELWHPHISTEEMHFSVPTLARVMSQHEHERLSALLVEFDQHHSGPDYLVLPFMLFNLDGDYRTAMIKEFPPVVTEQLIPIAWKDKWASMKPFLLP